MLIAYNPMLRLHLFLKVCFYVHHKVIWIDQSQTLSFVNTCAFTYAHKHGPHVSWKQEVRKSTHHSMFCEATPCSGSSHAQQNVSLENDECQEIETMGKETVKWFQFLPQEKQFLTPWGMLRGICSYTSRKPFSYLLGIISSSKWAERGQTSVQGAQPWKFPGSAGR